MPLPRLSKFQKAALAVALALLMWAPSGISQEMHPVVTGHSTFFNGETYDRCLASIAGILRSRVMWFNDMVLAERYAGKGTFVYVTEAGAENPANKSTLYSEGVFYDFVDPNGAHWHVEEAFMLHGRTHEVDYGNVNPDPFTGGVDPPGVRWSTNRTHVWIVELSERPIYDEFAGNDPANYHDLYNFLLIVDTCKMREERTTPYNITHEGTNLSTDYGHPVDATKHNHTVHDVNLWIGTRPTIVPIGMTTQTAQWQAEWTTNKAAGNTTMPCKPDDPTTPEDESGCN